jgi:hypothetical protein
MLNHNVRSGLRALCTMMLAPLLPLGLCGHILPLLAPLTTAAWKLLCLIYLDSFPTMVNLYYSRALSVLQKVSQVNNLVTVLHKMCHAHTLN